jgi:hypothetical protein
MLTSVEPLGSQKWVKREKVPSFHFQAMGAKIHRGCGILKFIHSFIKLIFI